jgi:glycosyltransferase involved in cell wall biosynthesis
MKLKKPVSVCIPAYNEEINIANAIDSILKQEDMGEIEIIVCANGCTDRTEDVIEDIIKINQTVKLIKSERGKAKAWNTLMNAAKNNYVFFLDADCYADKKAFTLLYTDLEQDLTLVGANPYYWLKNCDFINKILNYPPRSWFNNTLSGALYATNKIKLEHKLKISGYYKMPENIIREDLWLSLLVDEEDLKINHNSRVYTLPPKISELPELVKRLNFGMMQLKVEFPELYTKHNTLTNNIRYLESIKRKWNELTRYQKIVSLFTIPIRKLIYRAIDDYYALKAEKLYSQESNHHLWKPLTGTKKAISIN